MKKLISLAFVAAVAAALVGCSKPADDAAATPDATKSTTTETTKTTTPPADATTK